MFSKFVFSTSNKPKPLDDKQSPKNVDIRFQRGNKKHTNQFTMIKKKDEKEENKITLQNEKLFFDDILKQIPRDFMLKTNNGSCLFNIDLLTNTSSVISKFHVENPKTMEYYIDIDDKDNILQKFEQLYQGYNVVFEEDELPISKKITGLLNIKCCPNYMKPEILRTEEVFSLSNGDLSDGVEINRSRLKDFICQDLHQTFQIITNKNEYQCNKFSVFTSKTIRNFIKENPTTYQFKYDYEDENKEFSLICDYFNFQCIKIESNSIYSLKKISEDLKIEFILPKISECFSEYEKLFKTIDEQQPTVDLIEELFDLLYGIQKYSVDFVKSSILKSNWIKTKDDVIELAAFIIQVINSSMNLHPYLFDLLIELDKEANESNNLSILFQFVLNQLLFSFGETLENCSFVFHLYKKGFITKEKLLNYINDDDILKTINDRLVNICIWFLPEIIEYYDGNIDKLLSKISLRKSNKNGLDFIKSYYPDKIDQYIKLRDSGEPDDELLKAVHADDVDKVKLIISKDNIDLLTYKTPFNMLNYKSISLIDYAANYGSIKCFKFLYQSMNEFNFQYAISGSNSEIIEIATQKVHKKFSINDCESAISNHNNKIFDWLLEHKNDIYLFNLDSLLLSSASNGNAYTFIKIFKAFDKYDSLNFIKKYEKIINEAAKNGFYKLIKIMYNIVSQFMKVLRSNHNTNNAEDNNNNMSIYLDLSLFGNLSIFKFGLKICKRYSDIYDSLCVCVKRDYQNIFDYYFKEYNKNDNNDSPFIQSILKEAVKCKSNYYFNYLNERIHFKLTNKFDFFSKLLATACETNNIEKVEMVCDMIKRNCKRFNITKVFIDMAKSGNLTICQYFLNDKFFYIDINDLFSNDCKLMQEIVSLNKESFSMIIDKFNPELSESILAYSLNDVILKKNKDLLQFILNKDVPYDNALIQAVNSNDLDIVNIILNHDSDPSFLNQISKGGTALLIATRNNNLEIVKRLLSIPGIDPSLYGSGDQTPLELSITNYNFDIMNAILDFYGEKIQSQKWQLNNAIKSTLKILSNSKNNDSFIENKIKLLQILKRILEIKNIDPNLRGGEHTLLSYACETNEINIVKILHENKLIDVNAYAPKNGNTPLILAISNKNTQIAELLINDKRTNINAKNYDNLTPLIFACLNNLENIVSLLINNERFDPKLSCIDYAFLISSFQISKLLISVKSLDINYAYKNLHVTKKENSKYYVDKSSDVLYDSYSYETPLSKSIDCKDLEKIKLIINHPSFDKVKSQIIRCIFKSIRTNDIEIFKELLKVIDNDVNVTNNYHVSLLIAAIESSAKMIIEEILKNEKFDTKNDDIIKAFKYCLLNKQFSTDIINRIYELDCKHEHLIDLNRYFPDDDSYFILILKTFINDDACLQKRAKFLLDNGADPNLPGKDGIYPLEYAISLQYIDFIDFLLSSDKIDLNQKVLLGNKKSLNLSQTFTKSNSEPVLSTYLHYAAKKPNSKIIELFLKKESININAEDEFGNTPLIDACLSRNESCIKLLFDFQGQELDYLHKNKNGKDALACLEISSPNELSKSQYEQTLLSALSKNPKSSKFNWGKGNK